ncbi:MAG: hypothetical protein HOV79_08185 [Hamadaea sp.]|nr:hypothetical protein [Hamadaea sp.]
MTDRDLLRQTELLVGRVAHWTPARWNDRGEAVHALGQRLADACAGVEGQPARPLPRLADTALPDQLRVLVADLVAADAPEEVLDRMAADVRAVRHAL